MTAAELYEVVKDVPREAWPTMVVFVANKWAFETKAYPTGTKSYFMPTDVAESAFIGSMTAWLALKVAYSSVAVFSDGSAQVGLSNRIKSCRASSIVAALAAACKEVK